jgi:hypothetical protein
MFAGEEKINGADNTWHDECILSLEHEKYVQGELSDLIERATKQ